MLHIKEVYYSSSVSYNYRKVLILGCLPFQGSLLTSNALPDAPHVMGIRYYGSRCFNPRCFGPIRGASATSSAPSVRKVAGSNPTLAATLGKSFAQLPVALWCVNSDTVSMLQMGAPLSSSGLEDALEISGMHE